MSFKIVHAEAIPGKDLGESLLKSMDATLLKGTWQTEDDIISNARDADAVLGHLSRKPFNRRVLGELTKCRIIGGVSLGFEMVDLEAATEFGIVVTNVPDYCLDEVSGCVIALMLNLSYKILQLHKAIKESQGQIIGNMNKKLEVVAPVFRTRGQTLGIVGLANIGTATALKAKGLGMRVIAYDPYVPDGVMESRGIMPVDFDTLLKESDFISLHTPLTPATKGMFGYKEFKKMKPTCYFINTARGGCVDEAAMVRALQEKLIAGAGIDVTAEEPPPPENPLLKMPNVILTGHNAWYSTTAMSELFIKPMGQVVKALKGEWPPYTVNPGVRKKWLEKWS
ncbi:C-terminal binding protein [Chloroflexota bacterium]